jgi:predicted permease
MTTAILLIATFAIVGFAIGYFGGPVFEAIEHATDAAWSMFTLTLMFGLITRPSFLALIARAEEKEAGSQP